MEQNAHDIQKKNKVKQNGYTFLGWTVLPKMSEGSDCQSALLLATGTTTPFLWWVATKDEAALLSNRPHQVRAALGNLGWRWQHMLKLKPCQPGLPQLGIGRVLVCGGDERRTAEILQHTREDNDGGVWTLHT